MCIRDRDGFVRWKGGTSTSPYFLYVMRKYRKTGIANQFLSSVRYPGIGYMIAMGATAVWERWDALFEDGTMPVSYTHLAISKRPQFECHGRRHL